MKIPLPGRSAACSAPTGSNAVEIPGQGTTLKPACNLITAPTFFSGSRNTDEKGEKEMKNQELTPAYQQDLARMYDQQCCGLKRYVYPVRKVICPGCGKMFFTQEHNRKYCRGEACARLHRKKLRQQERTNLICTCCGKQFDANRRDAKFCSNACRQKAYRESAK